MELKLSDIDLVAFSHFHLDHNGAANAFTASELLLQRTEHDAAFVESDINPIFDPTLYNKLKDSPKTILDGDHDMFGDGHLVDKKATLWIEHSKALADPLKKAPN
jgi:N-acyl homoserine lactone hydrolase